MKGINVGTSKPPFVVLRHGAHKHFLERHELAPIDPRVARINPVSF
ncbi:MAG: hypothetical protein V3R24_07245 [Gemmatimonadales bacterium]